MTTENNRCVSCLQRDTVEQDGYAEALSDTTTQLEEQNGAMLLERILHRDNLNEAFLRVKRNKGAAGVDGRTIEETFKWLQIHKDEVLDQLRTGNYRPSPVRSHSIPKADGGVRKLGIPTVLDRVIQQAIVQILTPILEPTFSDNSYGYRPNRSAQQAVKRVQQYAEEGYKYAVALDLSKYFDTMNQHMLLNMVRVHVKDKRVIQLIKKFLRSGMMDNNRFVKTKEGSPQGGNLSPILANLYLDTFDKEFESRGVRMVRYADDIVLLAKSERAAKRLLESSTKFLEQTLKLQVNTKKSRVVSVLAIKHFKFLGFAFGRRREGIYIRVHAKSMRKMKDKLKLLTRRNQGRNVRQVMQNVKKYMQGWLGYYKIADLKIRLKAIDEWLRRRFRMYIWKQWKKISTKARSLMKLGVSNEQAYRWANTRLGYWRIAKSPILQITITNKRLVQAGYYDISSSYESMR